MIAKFLSILLLLVTIGFAKEATMFQSVSSEKATLLQKGPQKMFCIRCGMMLPKFYKTNHAIRYKNGKTEQYCSMHCLAETLQNTDPSVIEEILVVDVPSLKMIDAKKAWYVIGSNVKGTMTQNSKYAFAEKSDAEAFAKEHGGKVVDFDTALKIAKEDLAKDNLMIGKKRAHMAKVGAKVAKKMCDIQAIEALTYRGIGDLKAKIVEKKLCKNLKPKQLQAVAIYFAVSKTDQTADKIAVPKDAKCPVCGMFVAKYPKWAASITYPDGHTYYFDGVKDMMKYYFNPEKFHGHKAKPSKIMVQDFYSLKPVDATKAWYVIGSNVVGPMGNELIPFAEKGDARIFAKEHFGKKIVSFDQITEEMVYQLDQ
ncbi:MAG: hypothetical protein B6D59_02450 [Campylobacteraceae bacterium 4484_4]|nr:MAG: hypothetical protein B6D59_02450 [Campylobacteraceae bacterium 4484_4]